MNQVYKLNIDLLKITGAKQITGKDGKNYLAIDTDAGGVFAGTKGVYVNLDMWENKDGEDQYGNTHRINLSPTKEQREAKEKTPIVGNAKTLTFGNSQPQQKQSAPKDGKWIDDSDSQIPF